jgi:hypothetical protein
MAAAKGKGKKMSGQNVAIFTVLGLMVAGIVIMNVTGTTDKDLGLEGNTL